MVLAVAVGVVVGVAGGGEAGLVPPLFAGAFVAVVVAPALGARFHDVALVIRALDGLSFQAAFM